MKDVHNITHQRAGKKRAERGISIIELLIVVAMMGVVTAFAVMRIAGAQRAMQLSNSAREFMGWLEKARLDSVRRHAMAPGEMASVTITSGNSYTITVDQNGDGTLDPARTITIPATNGATFVNIAVPLTIRYNWRGRPVDDDDAPISLAFSLQDGAGNSNPINVTSSGDASLGSSLSTSTVSISGGDSSSNINPKLTIP
jgi:type II secretory pathway pseudopilin PulG